MGEPMPCQVCGRLLVPLRDGTSRSHTPRRAGTGGGEYNRCPGSRYPLARWTVGQRLIHHTGMIWEVVEDQGGPYGNYLIRCVDLNGHDSRYESVGREMVAHGEYLHRHGWWAAPPDLMAALQASLEGAAVTQT